MKRMGGGVSFCCWRQVSAQDSAPPKPKKSRSTVITAADVQALKDAIAALVPFLQRAKGQTPIRHTVFLRNPADLVWGGPCGSRATWCNAEAWME